MKSIEQPSSRRRYIKREYDMAEVRLRRIFDIPDDEMITYLEYDKPNSTIILTTSKDFDTSCGDK